MQKTKNNLKTVLLFTLAVMVLLMGFVALDNDTKPAKAASMELVTHYFGPLNFTSSVPIPVTGITSANFVRCVITSGNVTGQKANSDPYTGLARGTTIADVSETGVVVTIVASVYDGIVSLSPRSFHFNSFPVSITNCVGISGFVEYYQEVVTIVNYDVKFELNGGKYDGGGALNQTVLPNKYATAPIVSHTTKQFAGWFVSGLSTPQDISTYKITQNVVFTAQWTDVPVTKYTLTLDFGSGTCDGERFLTFTVIAGTTYNLPQNGLRTSYKFLNFKSDSGMVYTKTIVVSGDITLYAQWSYINYNVATFNVNGGHWVDGGELRQEVNAGEYPVEPILERDGYVFAGWLDSNGDTVFPEIYTLTKNMTFTAQWNKAKFYVIKFVLGDLCTSNGGSLNQSVQEGYAPEFPQMSPINDKVKFKGWSTKQNGTTYIDTKYYRANADVTLYAVWVMPEEFTVEFVYTDGTSNSLLQYVQSGDVFQTVYDGEYATAPVMRDVEGMNIRGWTVDGALVTVASYKITKNTVFVLNFTSTRYTVTFDINGGKHDGGGALTQTVIHPAKPSLPIVNRTNFVFMGWRYIGIDGLENTITNINDFVLNAPKDIEFSAVWGIAVSVFNDKNNEELKVGAEVVKDKYVIRIYYFKNTIMDRPSSAKFMAPNWGSWTNGGALVGSPRAADMRVDEFNNFLLYMYSRQNTSYNGRFFDFDLDGELAVRSLSLSSVSSIRMFFSVPEKGVYVVDYIELTLNAPSLYATYDFQEKLAEEGEGGFVYEWYIPYIFYGFSALLLVAAVFLITKGYGKEGAICLLVALAAAAITVVVFLL